MADKKKRKPGRPRIELTTELSKLLVGAFAKGFSYEMAAAVAGISDRTLRRWFAAGKRATSGPLFEFCRDSRKAMVVYAAKLQAEIEHAGKGTWDGPHSPNWPALAWILERRFPKWFGKKDEFTLKSGKAGRLSQLITVVEGPDVVDSPADDPEGD